MMESLVLYGSGERCRMLLDLLDKNCVRIAGIVDGNPHKWGEICNGFAVRDPGCLREMKNVSVCVTFYSTEQYEPVWDTLKWKYNIPEERIYTFHDILLQYYQRRWNNRFPAVQDVMSGDRKVLFDASWGLGLGGVETWLKDIVGGFDRKGMKNIWLVTALGQTGVPPEVEKHIAELYYPNAFSFTAQNVKKGIEFLIRQMPCKIILTNVGELMLAACLVKAHYPQQIETIMSVHSSCDGMYRDILSYRDSIDEYVCVSTGMKQDMIERGILSDKIRVMTCPITADVVTRSKTINMAGTLRIGYAGRLEVRQKRLDLLIKLVAELETRKIDYCLSIAGVGSYLEGIQDFIRKKRLEDRVILCGQIARENMNAFWRRQDITVNISDCEGRPISVMEAMVNGVVPIVTNTIGVLDDIQDGINGYIVPIGDYQAIVERIVYLANHRNQIDKMGRAAREKMRPKCNMDAHLRLWTEVLHMNYGEI